MWIKHNPNPTGRNVGDCSVRAISVALSVSWETAFAMLVGSAYLMADMPSSNEVWGAVLRRHGFIRESIPNTCPDCYTAGDFCAEHPEGIYVLGFGDHVAAVKDGDLYDSWDSTDRVPQYVWRK